MLGGMAVIGALAVLVVLGWVPLPGHGKSATEATKRAEPGPIAVTVAPVTPRPLQRAVQIVGTFQGFDEVTITPKVEGRVVRIAHDIGDAVKPGDVLMEIEDVDYRLAITEARRGLELELARVGLKEMPEGAVDVSKLPTVVRARNVEENALRKYQRAQRLRSGGASAEEEADQAATDHKVAQSNSRLAVLEAEATLAAARHRVAVLATAEQKLKDTKVVVPQPTRERLPAGKTAEYVVAQRMVTEGEMVRAFPSTTTFRLVMDRPLKLIATVPERYIGEVHSGQKVDLRVEAYPTETFQGTVSRVNPTVDRANRTFQVEVLVSNDDRRLRSGSFAKASIATRRDPKVPTIPEEAFVTFAGVTKVFVVRDGRAIAVPVKPAERVPVEQGGRREHWLEVIGNVEPGALVVTTGHAQLADGTPVRIRTHDAPN